MEEIHQLVERAKAGDRSAFAELVERYQKVAIAKAYSVIHDFHFAQDTAQDAFVIAFKQLATLKRSNAFGPWLLEIIRRQSLKALRGQESFRPFDQGTENEPIDLDTGWQDRLAQVFRELRKLPEHEQEVVVLYYLDGLPTKEVAQLVDRPLGTVTKQLSRGIIRLRNLLAEASHEPK